MKPQQELDFPNGQVSYWVRDAGGIPAPRAALDGDIEVDVAIVGGGLTGLWSAYYLKTARPELDIVVIEREFAGFGASGRNGGWLSAEPVGQFRRYAADRGEDAARTMQRELFTAIDEAMRVARQEGFADATAHNGLIHVATNQAQMARAREHVKHLKAEGWGDDDVRELTANEVTERIRVAGAVGGYGTQHCVRLQPAKFVFGLARAVEALGVRICENTRAMSVEPHAVLTERGTVRARHVVQALEGYTVSLRAQRRRLLPMNSSLMITRPLTDEELTAVGWGGGELLGDEAHSFTYLQLTADNRVAIGGRGVPYNFASSFDRQGRTAPFAVESLQRRLGELFPALQGIEVDHTWSGVLGVPRDWSAAVAYDRSTGVIRAGGYVGHGLSGTNLAGRTVRDLILGEDTPLTALPWVDHRTRNWEPEPLRWVGATALYAAYRFADRREYASQQTKTDLVAQVANLISGR